MGRNETHFHRMNEALDAELTAHDLEALEGALDESPDATAHWERMRRTDELLRTTPMIHPAPGFADRVMAALATLPMPGFARRTPGVGVALGLAVAALLAIPVLSVGLWLLLSVFTDPGALNAFLQTIINAASTVIGIGAEVLDALREAARETPLLLALLAALVTLAVLWAGMVWTLAGGSKALRWRQKS